METQQAKKKGQVRGRLLAVVAIVLTVGALKITAPVTLPLAFALFLVALFWPLQRRLEKMMRRGPAILLTLTACLLSLAIFVGALWFSAEQVSGKAAQYTDQLEQIFSQARSWLEARGLPASGGGSDASSSMPSDLLTRVANRAFSFVGALVLVIAFFVLALLEVHDFQAKVKRAFPNKDSQSWLEPTRRIAHDVQRYLVVRTVVGLITGVGTGLVAWLIGLDFALIWGLLNFLLNYIPTLGSIIGVVPPVLFALVQFNGVGMALLTLVGVGGVQLVMGNYVDPILQGKYLALSPLVVLLSVAFWGWLWGIAGAFIGIPLTVVIVIACSRFERTRPLALLLASRDAADEMEA